MIRSHEAALRRRFPEPVLGAGAVPRRDARALGEPAPLAVDAPPIHVRRLLRGRVRPQPQPLPHVPRARGQRRILRVGLALLRVPHLRVDPDAQLQPPQVPESAGRRVDHVAQVQREHVARRIHLLLRGGARAERADARLRSPCARDEPAPLPPDRGADRVLRGGARVAAVVRRRAARLAHGPSRLGRHARRLDGRRAVGE